MRLAAPQSGLDLPVSDSHQKNGMDSPIPVGAFAAHDAGICRTSGQTRERNILLPCTWPRGQTHHFPIDRHSFCSMKGWAGNSLKSSLPWQSYTGRNELLLETSVPTPTFLLLLTWGHLHLNLGIAVSPVLCWMFWTEIGEKQLWKIKRILLSLDSHCHSTEHKQRPSRAWENMSQLCQTLWMKARNVLDS